MPEFVLASTPPFEYSCASAAIPEAKTVSRYEAAASLTAASSLPKAKASGFAKMVSVSKKAATSIVYSNGLVLSWY